MCFILKIFIYVINGAWAWLCIFICWIKTIKGSFCCISIINLFNCGTPSTVVYVDWLYEILNSWRFKSFRSNIYTRFFGNTLLFPLPSFPPLSLCLSFPSPGSFLLLSSFPPLLPLVSFISIPSLPVPPE